jgi:hypothetical protein
MDAVIQVEVSEVRALVTNTCVIIFSGRVDDSMAFTWTTVHFNSIEIIENSIQSNAPNNSSLILV